MVSLEAQSSGRHPHPCTGDARSCELPARDKWAVDVRGYSSRLDQHPVQDALHEYGPRGQDLSESSAKHSHTERNRMAAEQSKLRISSCEQSRGTRPTLSGQIFLLVLGFMAATLQGQTCRSNPLPLRSDWPVYGGQAEG